jgi:hypothetical protein
MQNFDHITLVFEKNANFFRRKLLKIAENCDHNIDPRLGEISPFVRIFLPLAAFFKMKNSAQLVWAQIF